MDRRTFLHGVGAGLAGFPAGLLPAGLVAAPGPEHGFETVVELARALAAEPYSQNRPALGEPFADLDHTRFRGITPRPEMRVPLGPDGLIAIDLLPPGFIYEDVVTVDIVRGGEAEPLPPSLERFAFDEDLFGFPEGRAPDDLDPAPGYSGFAVRGALNRPDRLDEWLVFQGASQFRALFRGAEWGASARGLAIGTASAGGEEVPRFTRFWLDSAPEEEPVLRIHALLDSPSVAGAFAFDVVPGAETVMEVRTRLFPRETIAAAGIAPVSSMHFFGIARRGRVDDIRTAVHDSDGLQMVTGRGERLWRPLDNPAALRLSGFVDTDPQGFGLVQRRRDFEHYEDPEARFELRPSVWVEPRSGWGHGQIVLVEVPVSNAGNQNVFAFWRPSEPLQAGGDYAFDYGLRWAPLPPDSAPLARVRATRTGSRGENTDRRLFAIDFDFGELDADGVEPRVSASRGMIGGTEIVRLPRPGQLRAQFEFTPDGAELSELRLVLEGPSGPASETWLYRWTP